MRRRRLLSGLLAGAVVVVLTLGSMLRREPRYHGRFLSSWLADFDPGAPDHLQAQAAEAVRRIGTNAVPVLLRMIQTSEPEKATLKQRLRFLLSRPSLIKLKIKFPRDARWRAARAFEALGPVAEPAAFEFGRSVQRCEPASQRPVPGTDATPRLVWPAPAGRWKSLSASGHFAERLEDPPRQTLLLQNNPVQIATLQTTGRHLNADCQPRSCALPCHSIPWRGGASDRSRCPMKWSAVKSRTRHWRTCS